MTFNLTAYLPEIVAVTAIALALHYMRSEHAKPVPPLLSVFHYLLMLAVTVWLSHTTDRMTAFMVLGVVYIPMAYDAYLQLRRKRTNGARDTPTGPSAPR